MLKLSRYVLYDILRNKIILGYTIFLFVVSMSMFRMEENESKAVLSLLNIILIVVPLVSMIFATIHYYNSYEFIELMLSQPMSRTRILISEYIGVSLSLFSSFFNRSRNPYPDLFIQRYRYFPDFIGWCIIICLYISGVSHISKSKG